MAVPLALIAIVAIALLVWSAIPRGGPFGPLQPAPPPDGDLRGGDEVGQWALEEGLAHYRAGEFEEASVLLARAAGGSPDRPVQLFYTGVSHLMCERSGVARDLIQRAVNLRPEEPMYRYYLAWALYLDGQPEQAAAELEVIAGGEDRWSRLARRTRGRL